MEYLKVFSRNPARDEPSHNLQPQDLEKNGTAKGCFFAWPGKNPWSILVFGFGGTISTLPFGLGANAVGCFHKGISRENVFAGKMVQRWIGKYGAPMSANKPTITTKAFSRRTVSSGA